MNNENMWSDDGRGLVEEQPFLEVDILKGFWKNKKTKRMIEIRNPITLSPKVRLYVSRTGRRVILVPVYDEFYGQYLTKEKFLSYWEPITREAYLTGIFR